MTMIDLYLKAGSKSAMTLALKTAGFSQDPDTGELYHPDSALAVIGTIYKPTGEKVMIDGRPEDVMAPLPGYHVNVRTKSAALATALDAQRTYPETPTQKWA